MGSTLSILFQQSLPPKPTWGVDEIPDLTGKVILVTGGNTGIGKETVKLDLSDIPAVRKSAQEFLSKESQLHVLINNAGVMMSPKEQVTVQKYDMQFGTNVIGHWLLTELLLPALFAATDASSSHEKARVVTVSSIANYSTALDFDAIADGPKRTKYGKLELYRKSKFGNVVVARELARRYGDKIVSTSLNPGNIRTDLLRHQPGWRNAIAYYLMYPVSYGALTQLYCATAPSAADANGKFFIPWVRVGEPNKGALEPQVGEKLWSWLENETKKY
ncbi:NAD(P)-binding protein [Lactarius vividus]|nr:NAD(P)-binding protein [Lactarius vividus]